MVMLPRAIRRTARSGTVCLALVMTIAAGAIAQTPAQQQQILLQRQRQAQLQQQQLQRLQAVRQQQLQRQQQNAASQRAAQPQRTPAQRPPSQAVQRPTVAAPVARPQAPREQAPRETVRRPEPRQPVAPNVQDRAAVKHIETPPAPLPAQVRTAPAPVVPPRVPSSGPAPAKPIAPAVLPPAAPSNIDAIRQQRIEALQQQRRDQQQTVRPATPPPGGLKADSIVVPPAPARPAAQVTRPASIAVAHGASPTARAVKPIAADVALAKIVARPVVAIGPANASGGVRTTATANRKLMLAANAVRSEFKTPLFGDYAPSKPGAPGCDPDQHCTPVPAGQTKPGNVTPGATKPGNVTPGQAAPGPVGISGTNQNTSPSATGRPAGPLPPYPTVPPQRPYPGQGGGPYFNIPNSSPLFWTFSSVLATAAVARIAVDRSTYMFVEKQESGGGYRAYYEPRPQRGAGAGADDDDDEPRVYPGPRSSGSQRLSNPQSMAKDYGGGDGPAPSPAVSSPPGGGLGGGAVSPVTAGPGPSGLGSGSGSGGGSGTGPGAAAMAAKSAVPPPKPAETRAAGPDTVRASLGGLGGGAFDACTPASTTTAQADGASMPGADDDTTSASPVHFMLETGGHLATIRSVVFTASGKCLLSAGDDKVIRIWSLVQGRSDRVLRGEIDTGAKGTIYALALSPDGTLLAAGGSMDVPDQGGHAIRLYDLRSGAMTDLLIGHTGEVRALAFSPDGRRLLSGSADSNAVLWDIEGHGPLQVFAGHSEAVISVSFSPDGERVATASTDKTARLWSTADGAALATLEGHEGPLVALAVRARDGSVVTASQDGGVKLWNGRDGALVRSVAQLEFSPGALVASPGSDNVVITCADRCRRNFEQTVLNLSTGKPVATYGQHDGFVFAAAITPDGTVATAGGTRHEIHLWSAGDAKPVQVLKGLGRTVSATGFYNDSRTFAWSYTFANTSHLKRGPMEASFDIPGDSLQLGEPLPFDNDAADGFVHSVDRLGGVAIESNAAGGNVAGTKGQGGGGGAAGPRSGVVTIVQNGTNAATIVPDENLGKSFAYRSYGIMPSGEHVLVGGDSGTLEAYDLSGQRAVTYAGHAGTVWTQTPSPDGRLLVSGGGDQTVKLWNLATGELIVTLFQATDGEWVMWTPQGYYAGSAGGGELVGWQVNRGDGKAADYVRAQQLRGYFNRPDIVARAIALAGAQDAVAELAPQHVPPEVILAQGVPPVVAMLDGDRETTGGRGTIVVGLKENPLPIEELKIWVRDIKVTGKPVDVPANLKREPGIDYMALEIPLFGGDNDVRVAASNEIGASDQAEKSLSIRIVHNGEGALDKRGTLFLLAVGVDKYAGLGKKCNGPNGTCDLLYAGGDAEGFAATAEAEMSRSHERVNAIVLVNGKGAEREPTLANIKAALVKFQEQATSIDTVAMFFAGHGENLGGSFYFMPTDALSQPGAGAIDNALNWSEVQGAISHLDGRKLLFLDACHAANSYYAKLGEDARLSRFIAFAAATGAQSAEEAPDVGHGEFTYALMSGLKGEAAPKADSVLVYDLASYVSKQVITRTKGRQTPEFIPTPGEGNYALVKR